MAGISVVEAHRLAALIAAELGAHYEVSPLEREDNEKRDERDFGTQEHDDEARDEPQPWTDDD